ncbi:GyrI-like domain-containing protein [Arthrobacter sp. C152]
MSDLLQDIGGLYKARKGAVDFVDVPMLLYAIVRGTGDPNGPAFAEAVQALFTVSYAAHFRLKKETGEATKMMPLEALWWFDDPTQPKPTEPVTAGFAGMSGERESWRWQAMMVQPGPIDEALLERAVQDSRPKGIPALDLLSFEQWEEGRCAQTMHVGPYADEAPTIARLDAAITAAGLKARGRHHEIYLGDPRRSAPEKLRTLIRHPVA